MPWRTFRFNECVCGPYNADFDGDEMNIFFPQTEEAKAEAVALMDVAKNLITPRHGKPVIAAIQDFITASYLLSRKDNFFDRAEFCQICTYLVDGAERVDIPPAAIQKPVELWTGKQVFSVWMRPRRDSEVRLNLTVKSGSYTKDADKERRGCMDGCDGFVVIRQSTLMCGVMDKKSLGSGSKDSIFHVLMRDYGYEVSAHRMSTLAKMCARWLSNRGFSIGISDVTPSASLLQHKMELIKQGYDECDDFVGAYNSGELKPQPGFDRLQTLEAKMNKTLSDIRETVGDKCMEALHSLNAPLVMAVCGSKGSKLNISQMVACVGQQTVGGTRVSYGFLDRSLPHFRTHSRSPAAGGFVQNSFYTGLTPVEFFFHTMGGREGLVDTAVKTADSGYNYRRLMAALGDLYVDYDDTVRNSERKVVQFLYGGDSLDPVEMEGNECPVDFDRQMLQLQAAFPDRDGVVLSPAAIRRRVERALAHDFADTSGQFQHLLSNYLTGYASRMEDISVLLKGLSLEDNADDNISDSDSGDDDDDDLMDIEKGSSSSSSSSSSSTSSSGRKKVQVKVEKKNRKGRKGKKTQMVAEDEETVWWKRQEAKHHWVGMEEEGEEAAAYRHARDSVQKLTEQQMEEFLKECRRKYHKARMEPGTAVGAICAQSLGEPATQMTLKTFHFAGVASMNVTQGVPRIKEVMNAAKKISVPVVEAALVTEDSETAARIVKGRIEKTTLGNVSRAIDVVYSAERGCFIQVELDLALIDSLHLELDMKGISNAIMAGVKDMKPKVKDFKAQHIIVEDGRIIRIYPPASRGGSRQAAGAEDFFTLHNLRIGLPNIVIKGVQSVKRVVINKSDKEPYTYQLLIEGTNMRRIMTSLGVDCLRTTASHIKEVEEVLGIEAARRCIIGDIVSTMDKYGMALDGRHVMLLGDLMTSKGEVLGCQRFDLPKLKESVLAMASFERTNETLCNAAIHDETDYILGPSERIIVGAPIRLGTGLFQVLQRVQGGAGAAAGSVPMPRRSCLFETWMK